MRKNSVKNRRINDEVMRCISEIIRDIKDPRVSPMTSVMSALVAPDLKTCKVRVTVLGSEEEKKQTLEGLVSARGFIRSELAHRINLRNTPELAFSLDDSIAYGVDMGSRIDAVMQEDERSEEERRARGIDIGDLTNYTGLEEEDDNSDLL